MLLPDVGGQVPAASKPVGLNFDVDRELHHWLKSFALQADSDVVHVVWELLAELLVTADMLKLILPT